MKVDVAETGTFSVEPSFSVATMAVPVAATFTSVAQKLPPTAVTGEVKVTTI